MTASPNDWQGQVVSVVGTPAETALDWLERHRELLALLKQMRVINQIPLIPGRIVGASYALIKRVLCIVERFLH